MSPTTLDRPASTVVDAERAPWRRRALEALCAVDSTTGTEDRLLPILTDLLRGLGAKVQLQRVDGRRANLLARWPDPWARPPRLLLTTHLDTVPPFRPPRAIEGGLAGRGTCDAKGQIVAQLAAIRRLLAAGERRFAWLGVIGEETDGAGAAAALDWSELTHGYECVILGEPTGNRLASGQKGYLHVELRCRGRRAHGADPMAADPRRGGSAIWRLHRWLRDVRDLPARQDSRFGRESWNLGRIEGGEAVNVVAGEARAELAVRTVPGSTFAADARRLAPVDAEVEILSEDPPMAFAPVGGWPSERSCEAVGFGSDAPRLAELATRDAEGRPRIVLLGPGSIAVAHTDDEHLLDVDLGDGIDTLVELCRHLLARPSGGGS
ncbi:MAG: M20/M25/M40 family metallo-hydrolase [Acidobacteriota bacterium]